MIAAFQWFRRAGDPPTTTAGSHSMSTSPTSHRASQASIHPTPALGGRRGGVGHKEPGRGPWWGSPRGCLFLCLLAGLQFPGRAGLPGTRALEIPEGQWEGGDPRGPSARPHPLHPPQGWSWWLLGEEGGEGGAGLTVRVMSNKTCDTRRRRQRDGRAGAT